MRDIWKEIILVKITDREIGTVTEKNHRREMTGVRLPDDRSKNADET